MRSSGRTRVGCLRGGVERLAARLDEGLRVVCVEEGGGEVGNWNPWRTLARLSLDYQALCDTRRTICTMSF